MFDADACVHKFLQIKGSLVNTIGNIFPKSIKKSNGNKYIDRKVLGDIVFRDKEKRKILEDIIHPEVNNQRKKWKYFVQREGYRVICFDVPLLFETKGEKYCDYIVVASCPFFIQKQRVLARKNMTMQKFYHILNNQISDHVKRKKADFVINTGNGYRFSRNQVNNVINKIIL